MSGNYFGAHEDFEAAISFLAEADLADEERHADWEQTAIYRAFNAIDGRFPNAKELVNEVNARTGTAEGRAGQFRHHLWLRLLYSDNSHTDERKAYLDGPDDDLLDTHPWQLIAMYRGIFTAELENHEQSVHWFNEAIRIAIEEAHGSTLRMIGSVIATVAWLETGEPSFQTCALEILDRRNNKSGEAETLEAALPSVAIKAQRIREVLAGSRGCWTGR